MLKKFFKDLFFEDEKHRYYLDNKILKSVSSIFSSFAKPFDLERISKAYALKNNMTQEEVKDSWKKINEGSLLKGNSLHKFAEEYPLNPLTPPHIHKFFITEVLPFYTIEERELKMYHKEYLFAGTADLILKNKETGKYVVVDFKTNKDLFKNFKGQRLLGAFYDYYDTPFNKYQIQLSLYKILLQQAVEVEELWIVHLTEDDYKKYISLDLSDTLIHLF